MAGKSNQKRMKNYFPQKRTNFINNIINNNNTAQIHIQIKYIYAVAIEWRYFGCYMMSIQ